jgi:hypothetical protein
VVLEGTNREVGDIAVVDFSGTITFGEGSSRCGEPFANWSDRANARSFSISPMWATSIARGLAGLSPPIRLSEG